MLVLDGHLDGSCFSATESEMIIVNADLNRIAERRGLHHAHWRAGHQAHLHKPKSVGAFSINRRNATDDILGNRIESHCCQSSLLVCKLKLKITFKITSLPQSNR